MSSKKDKFKKQFQTNKINTVQKSDKRYNKKTSKSDKEYISGNYVSSVDKKIYGIKKNLAEVKKVNGGLPVSLWDTYSSFANCYGGVIILGVKENKDGSWRTTGLQNASKLRKEFWDNINNPQKVNINLLTEDNLETYQTF